MSKAVLGAVEIAGAFVATAWAGGIGGLAAIAANGGMVGSLFASTTESLALSGIATEAGAIAQAIGSNNGMGVTTRTPAGLRQIIRGTQRVGGTIVYSSTSGSSKRQYNLVIVLATHPCEAIENLYLDGRQVFWQVGSSYNQTVNGVNFGGTADPGTFIGPNGQKYSFGSEVFCAAFQGKQTSAPTVVSGTWVGPTVIDDTTASYPGFCSALQANDGTWSPSSQSAGGAATAYATWSTDPYGGHEIDSITVNYGGVGYPDGDVYVTITDPDGGGSGASAHGIASGGVVTSIVLDSGGGGYINPQVTIAPPSTVDVTPYLGGCTYVYLKLEADSGTFPQFPEIRFTVRGKNDIYDPRTNTSGYTTNWALHVADAITDPIWGLGDDSVNQDQLIAAANVCDEYVSCSAGVERRYALNWHYDASTAPGDVIVQMQDAAAGRTSRIGGEWFIWPAYWQGPSFTFDENSLIGEIQWYPKRSFSELCNRITGTYIAANYPYNVAGNLYDSNGYWNGETQNNFPFAFQPSNYPMYACDTLHGYGAGIDVYLQQDGGIFLPREVNQQCVLSISQAQRCAKIILLRNRQQGTGTMLMNPAAMQMQPTDVMHFNMPSLSWTNKVLEISKWEFKEQKQAGVPGYYVQVEVQETDASVYEWEPTEELTPYDVPVITSGTTSSYVVEPPTNVSLENDTSTSIVLSDGTSTSRVLVTWTPPVDTYVQNGGAIQIQYRLYDTTGVITPIRPVPIPYIVVSGGTHLYPTNWVDDGTVSGQATHIYISVPTGYVNISVQLRSVRSNGATSDWVQDSLTTGSSPLPISRPAPVFGGLNIGGTGLTVSGGATVDYIAIDGDSSPSLLVNSITPTLLWSYQVPSKQSVYSTPIMFTNYGRNTIAFQSMDWYLYTLQASNGALDWSKAFSDQAYGRPQAADVLGTGNSYVYGSSYDGEIHCLDHTGANVWQFHNSYSREGSGTATSATANTLTNTTKSWAVGEFQSPRAAGAGYGATLHITGGTGSGQSKEITSVSAHTLTVVSNWSTNPDSTSIYTIVPRYSSDIYYEHSGTLSQESGTWYLYVTGFDGECVKLNAVTGALVWKFEVSENIEPFPLITDVNGDGLLECLISCVNGYIYCLKSADGTVVWSTQPETTYSTNQLDAFLSAADINADGITEVLVSCRSSRVFVIQGTTGNVLAATGSYNGDTYAGIDNEPAILDPVSGISNFVYGNHAGYVTCCDPNGNTLWKTNIGVTINSSIRYADLFNTGIKVLVVCDMYGTVSIINPNNGTVIGIFGVKGGIEGTPLIGSITGTGNQLLITTLDGYVQCYNVTAN